MANTWDQIVEKVEEALKKQNFTRAQDEAEEGGRSAVFTGEALAYAVTFTPSTKRIELRTCAMKEDGPDKQWKVLSSWLYDPASEEEADVESIVNDFCDTVEGPKRQKGEESTQDPTFMFNRFAGIYPEIRADLVDERSTYGTARPIAFTRAHILPRVRETLAGERAESPALQKIAQLLSDLYENGDFDVRNSLDEAVVKEKMEPMFSQDLKKGYKAGLKVRGKKIKPEKVKKQPRVVAEALKNTQRK